MDAPFSPMLAPDDPSGPALVFAFRERKLLLVEGRVPSRDVIAVEERSLYLGRLGDTHCYAHALPGAPGDGFNGRE